VLVAMLVLGVLATRMRRVFGDTDLHRLQELRD
jgi:hydrogenase-4 membrane subunit HyfE